MLSQSLSSVVAALVEFSRCYCTVAVSTAFSIASLLFQSLDVGRENPEISQRRTFMEFF